MSKISFRLVFSCARVSTRDILLASLRVQIMEFLICIFLDPSITSSEGISLFISSRTALGSNRPSFKGVMGVKSADHSPPTGFEVQNGVCKPALPSVPSYHSA
jgi:hypothetical protein